jgi:hypothetical protein
MISGRLYLAAKLTSISKVLICCLNQFVNKSPKFSDVSVHSTGVE